jgi:trk system potassium uptake protein TrkA
MKQFAVIGVGNFGAYLARRLYEKGDEVLVIDSDASRIQEIRDNVSRAMVADATDPKVLTPLGLDQMEAITVSVGDNIAAAILITLNLKDCGVERLVVKTVSEPQGRVLQKVGATDVLFPEKDMALTLAERLHSPNVLEYLPFMDDYSIIEMTPPAHTVGKPLRELDLINRYGIQIIAIKEIQPERTSMVPRATYVLKDNDILIVLGSREGIEKMRRDSF